MKWNNLYWRKNYFSCVRLYDFLANKNNNNSLIPSSEVDYKNHTTAIELGKKPNSQEYYSLTKKATGSTSDESRLHGF